jgi:putative ABC transport system permease protein
MVPIKYNLRSLKARAAGSLMTIFSTGLVVWASVLSFALSSGLNRTLQVSAGPLDVIVLRQGATSETASGITEAVAREIVALPGIATDAEGHAMCSPELVVVINTPRRGGGGNANVTIRGVTTTSPALRNELQVIRGRMFRPGLREVIASQQMAARFRDLGLGSALNIHGAMFRVVGIFQSGGGAAESEVWADLKVLTQAAKRTGSVSSVQLRSASKSDQQRLVETIKNDERIALKAVTEEEFFREQEQAGIAIKVVGLLIAFFLTVGAAFGVSNTMYGAIASRAREIGTLRALGFGRVSILAAFLFESLVLCLLGAGVGYLGTVPLHGMRSGTMNSATFTEIAFAFDFGPSVLLKGIGLAIFMGVAGGLLPAIRAVRIGVAAALREG